MAELAAEAVGSLTQPPAGHDPSPDPRAEGEQDDVGATACRTRALLAEGRRVRVVDHRHDAAGGVGEELGEGKVTHADVRPVPHAPARVDHAGDADADRQAPAGELVDQPAQARDELVRITSGCDLPAALEDPAVRVDGRRDELGPPDVDAERGGGHGDS